MKLIVNKNGDSIENKDWKIINYDLGLDDDSPFGKNYYWVGVNIDDEIVKLLKKYDNSDEMKFYINNEILYITFDNEPYHYLLELDSKLNDQIMNKQEVLFGVINRDQGIDFYLGYNKIFK